jgi:hypothetical protein
MERFRAHYFEGIEELVTITKPTDPDALCKLQRAATEGLSSDQNALIDGFLDRFKPARIAQLCADTPANGEQIIAQERRNRAEFRKQHRDPPE